MTKDLILGGVRNSASRSLPRIMRSICAGLLAFRPSARSYKKRYAKRQKRGKL